MVFTTKKEKNGVTKNIDINIVSYLISMARSRVPTIVEIETEIDIPLTSALNSQDSVLWWLLSQKKNIVIFTYKQ